MQAFEIIAASVGLGVDAFSVCLGIGTRWHGPRQKFRLSWHMGLFQLLMPLAGYYASRSVAVLVQSVGPWIAFVVLAFIGGKMLVEAIRGLRNAECGSRIGEAERPASPPLLNPQSAIPNPQSKDPTRGWSLMALSLATSLDALAVGFAVGLRQKHIWPGAIVIGLTAGVMSLTGVALGQRASARFGRWAEAFGGAMLVVLGIVMVAGS